MIRLCLKLKGLMLNASKYAFLSTDVLLITNKLRQGMAMVFSGSIISNAIEGPIPRVSYTNCSRSCAFHTRISFISCRRRHDLVALAATGGYDTSSFPQLPNRSLGQLCHTMELCFFELCIKNMGRPAGLALHDFVSAVAEAFSNGYTRDQVSLQLAFGSAVMHEFEIGTAGCRLTSTEEHYRSKWLETIYTTLQILLAEENAASRAPMTTDMNLYSTIRHVLDGQSSGDEQSVINFDRGLATKGASGGVVTQRVVIAPQWVPVSQLVLLTIKVVHDSK